MSINVSIKNSFEKYFKESPSICVASPGRINLIGEHTDYNNGFVLPAAIDKSIQVALTKREDKKIHLHSLEFNETMEVDLAKLEPVSNGWPNYVLGVVDQLLKLKHKLLGFNISIDGDIPIGAGLSSSAAIECAVVFALNELFKLNLEKKQMVLIAQKAEHEFAGVKCGVMDQFGSMFGKKNHVIKLDCKNLEYEYFPLVLNDFRILLFDTQVKHSLASSEYNIRRRECETGVAIIQQKFPKVRSLRDATPAIVEKCLADKDEKIYHRCKYVVEEIERLVNGTKDLNSGDLVAFGKKMYATHEGLSKLYQVSCPELDVLVDAVKDYPQVLGARMMGGGFGGCTINIVKTDQAPEIIKKTEVIYNNRTGKNMKTWMVNIEDGTHLI